MRVEGLCTHTAYDSALLNQISSRLVSSSACRNDAVIAWVHETSSCVKLPCWKSRSLADWKNTCRAKGLSR